MFQGIPAGVGENFLKEHEGETIGGGKIQEKNTKRLEKQYKRGGRGNEINIRSL